MDEHGSALVHDLRVLGVDLRDLWRVGTELTPRYVLMLIEHLSDDSALHARVRGGPEHRPWTFHAQLLATIANLLYAANRQRGGKKTKAPLVEPPKPKRQARVVRVAELLKRSGSTAA